MLPAYEAIVPAAKSAFWELSKKTMMVLDSSVKTRGIRTARTIRKSPIPIARKIPIGFS